jgi:GTPase Era involved in 16S rRNA processing
MMKNNIPTFAILGHPNEGKSSVVSTLAEDDGVPISPIPGETKKCREYPVIVDGREIIRFIDTPGFQQPRKTCEWMKRYQGPGDQITAEFIIANGHNPDFIDECELLAPLAAGAGIIYVADGSRPYRSTDAVEMEILRMTGLPRMAIINAKEKSRADFLDEWKAQARRNFNTVRMFNAHQATYAERIELLESIKNIDPDWQPHLAEVIEALKKDWDQRIKVTAAIIIDMIQNISRHTLKKTCDHDSHVLSAKTALHEQFGKDISHMEKAAHKNIRKQFKHNIFSYDLPAHSILNEDLFSEKSQRVLGLKNWQLAIAGGAGGAAIGAKIDLATAGHSFALGAIIGGIIGAGTAALGVRHAATAKISGLPLGRIKVQVGPVQNSRILYVLIDRALIYFSYVINWAHSRRDLAEGPQPTYPGGKIGYTSAWNSSGKQVFAKFFKILQKEDLMKTEKIKSHAIQILTKTLYQISTSSHRVE